MIDTSNRDSEFNAVVKAIVVGDAITAFGLLAASPELARASAGAGATQQTAKAHYLEEIEHYIYAGDTALHIAAAAYRKDVAVALITAGAEVHARNRRGAEPLHYAVDGVPASRTWDPDAQAKTIGMRSHSAIYAKVVYYETCRCVLLAARVRARKIIIFRIS